MLRQPNKLMLAGDWHRDLPWAFKAINFAAREGIDTILHVGDFGWYASGDVTRQYLTEIQKELDHFNIDLLWVDGNHDDHSQLEAANNPEIGAMPWCMAEWPRITHLPRGFRWVWWDEDWMSLGGAHSIDRRALWNDGKASEHWWPGERLTDSQIEYAMRPGPVDVIISHDAPAGAQIPGIDGTGPNERKKKWNPNMFPAAELLLAEDHRRLLKKVVDDKLPLALYHGHYHVAYQDAYRLPGGDYCRIRGLDKNGHTMGRNTVIITKGALDGID